MEGPLLDQQHVEGPVYGRKSLAQQRRRCRTVARTCLVATAVIAAAVAALHSVLGAVYEVRDEAFLTKVESALEQQMGGLDDMAKLSAEFLVGYMPVSDVANLSPDFVATNIRLALTARKEFASQWGGQTPDPVFLNEVLPYAVLSEPRDDWRALFYKFMREKVSSCSNATCAVLTLNKEAWKIVDPPIIYVAAKADELNSYSPFETMQRHNASCTGLSIFLIDALRSVGVPARLAGVPHWNRGRKICPNGDLDAECGNHNWVECFVDGAWHFLDQHGEINKLDVGWFYPDDTNLQTRNAYSMNHSIFSTSWAPGHVLYDRAKHWYSQFYPADHFPMVFDWSNHDVNAFETIHWYQHRA